MLPSAPQEERVGSCVRPGCKIGGYFIFELIFVLESTMAFKTAFIVL